MQGLGLCTWAFVLGQCYTAISWRLHELFRVEGDPKPYGNIVAVTRVPQHLQFTPGKPGWALVQAAKTLHDPLLSIFYTSSSLYSFHGIACAPDQLSETSRPLSRAMVRTLFIPRTLAATTSVLTRKRRASRSSGPRPGLHIFIRARKPTQGNSPSP